MTRAASIRRRRLLQLGVGGAVLLAVGGGGLALLKPGLSDGRLTSSGRAVFGAVARAVLADVVPKDGDRRERALAAHLDRLDDVLAGMPPYLQAELSQALALLAAAPGRWALAGLATSWEHASAADVQAALDAMRRSSIATRQQLYHALRDLTTAAWFVDPVSWPLMSYPGPSTI